MVSLDVSVSTAIDIYFPAQAASSPSAILVSTGFEVVSTPRRLPSGASGVEHRCTLRGATFTLTESQLPNDSSYIYLLGLAGSESVSALVRARDVLMEHGALDASQYASRTRHV